MCNCLWREEFSFSYTASPDFSKRNTVLEFPREASLLSALQGMSKHRAHRIAVVSNGIVSDVVSQRCGPIRRLRRR